MFSSRWEIADHCKYEYGWLWSILTTLESVDVKVYDTLEDEMCSQFQDLDIYGRYFMDLLLRLDSCAAFNAVDFTGESDYCGHWVRWWCRLKPCTFSKGPRALIRSFIIHQRTMGFWVFFRVLLSQTYGTRRSVVRFMDIQKELSPLAVRWMDPGLAFDKMGLASAFAKDGIWDTSPLT